MPLTDTDIKNIQKLVQTEIGLAVDPLKEKISNLPTKDEFFTYMDHFMKEIKDVRQEQPIIAHQIRDHEKRIKRLETHQNLSAL